MGLFTASTGDLHAAALRLDVLRRCGDPNEGPYIRYLLHQNGFVSSLPTFFTLTDFDGVPVVKGCYAWDGTATLIFIGGVVSAAAAQKVWAGYMGPVLGQAVLGVNQLFTDIVNRSFLDCGYSSTAVSSDVVLCGYSAGGAIAKIIPSLWGGPGIYPFWRVCTFGSPKPGGLASGSGVALTEITRWMVSNDTVPNIPPSMTAWQRFWTIGASIWQRDNLLAFLQPAGGTNIAFDGTLTIRATPADADLDQVRGMTTWLYTAAAGQENPHSLTSYVGRIAAAIALGGPRTAVDNRGSAPEVADVPARGEQSRILNQQQITFNAAHAGTSVGSVVIPPALLFGVKRAGRTWLVTFGQRIIASAPHKRGARQLARIGNAFIRSLQARSAVYTIDFAEEFTSYLEAAGDPASGVVPQLTAV